MYEVIRTKISDREKRVKPYWSHGIYETEKEAKESLEMMSLFDNCLHDFKIEKILNDN